ncbi:MAG: M50 family metallopeptidase [Pseudomonadota bacterium]
MRLTESVSSEPIKSNRPSLPAAHFWGLCVVVYMMLHLPAVRLPVLFLTTWVHELGHGLGAIMTGGRFLELTVFPNLSGLALTETRSDFSRAVVIIMGLLGPSLLGVIMIGLTRGLGRYRLAMLLLAFTLALSLIWAADLFTVGAICGATLIIGLLGWKLPDRILIYVAYILAIALCLSALTGFGYFFMGNAEVAGQHYLSDTGVLAQLWGGSHWLWGGLLTLLSIVILIFGVAVSNRLARKRMPE